MRHLVWMAVAAMTVAATLTASPPQAVGAGLPAGTNAVPPDEPKWAPGELLVRFRPGVGAARRAAVRADGDARLRKSLPLPGLELLRLAPGDSVRSAAAEFEDDSDVLYAEPNFHYQLNAVPKDPRFPELWALHNTGQLANGYTGTADADIDAPEAWETTTGSSAVTVGVVDSGVAYDHPDLAANIWSNPGEIADNGIDDDGDRWIDDVRGYDFIDSDNSPRDVDGHGTHVAGTIAARGNNGQGVAGVNWNSSVMPLRACSVDGCPTSAIVSAFFYAVRNGAQVINASFGSPSFSQVMHDVIDLSPDTLFVAAAGNEGLNLDAAGVNSYPCEMPLANVICVGATDQRDAVPTFSNYGATAVDLAAPGVNVLSPFAAPDTVFSEGFEGDISATWTTGGTNNTWARTSERARHGSFSLADSPGANYLNNTDSFARTTNAISLAGRTDCALAYELRLASQEGQDGLIIERSTNAVDWSDVDVFSGSSGGGFVQLADSLADVSGQSKVYLRFRMISDSATADDGVHIDDVQVLCPALTYDATDFDFLHGTSMAAPHVTGTAALMWADTPGAPVAEIRQRLLANVDALPSLTGRTVTGGRLNAAKAVESAPPAVAATQPPTAITPTSATLKGTVNPRWHATSYRFEYGKTTSYGQSTTVQNAGTGNTAVAVNAPVTALEPATTYHYRLVATYSNRTVATDDAQFTTAAIPPVVTCQPATAITTTTAVANGTVDPRGAATTYRFEYGTTTDYGLSTGSADAGDGRDQVAVSAQLTGLEPGTTYHVRLVATNSGGTAVGDDAQFTTAPLGEPVVAMSAATMVLRTSATLNGTVDPAGKSTLYRFQYGTTTAYGTSTSPEDAGAGTGPLAVSVPLTGLAPGTTYHFRLVATNADGTVVSGDAQFTTASVGPPAVALAAPTLLTKRSATLNGSVDPRGVATSYHFEYGPTTAYGNSTTPAEAAPGSGARAISAALSDLAPGTTYHFRLVATNADGTTVGGDAQFSTAALTAPMVAPAAATMLTRRGATLNGTVDARGVATTYHFEYGPTTAYGQSTALANAGAGSGEMAVSAPLTGLAPGATYHFRLVATSDDGTTHSDDAQFTTAALTAPLVTPAAATMVTRRGATLNGTVDPRGVATTYHFEYGPTTAYGESTTLANAGADSGQQAVSVPLTGLAPGTTYHVRLVATSDDGTTHSDDAQFTTAPPLPPVVALSPANAITRIGATLNGTVNPQGVATTYHFEYGTTTNYGRSTAPVNAGAGSGALTVTAPLSGLAPATPYHYRLVATSDDGTARSADARFTTAAVPPPVPSPTPQPAPAPRPAPSLEPFRVIVPATLRLDRRGAVTIRLAFPASTPAGVGRAELFRGRAPATASRRLSPAPAYANLARAPKRIGSASFTTKPGQTVRLRIRLTKAGRRLVTSRGSIAATVRVTVPSQVQAKQVRVKRQRS